MIAISQLELSTLTESFQTKLQKSTIDFDSFSSGKHDSGYLMPN